MSALLHADAEMNALLGVGSVDTEWEASGKPRPFNCIGHKYIADVLYIPKGYLSLFTRFVDRLHEGHEGRQVWVENAVGTVMHVLQRESRLRRRGRQQGAGRGSESSRGDDGGGCGEDGGSGGGGGGGDGRAEEEEGDVCHETFTVSSLFSWIGDPMKRVLDAARGAFQSQRADAVIFHPVKPSMAARSSALRNIIQRFETEQLKPAAERAKMAKSRRDRG